MADANMFFDASFLFFTEDAMTKIANYVTDDAVPLMTSSTPFGRIDPNWSDSFLEQGNCASLSTHDNFYSAIRVLSALGISKR